MAFRLLIGQIGKYGLIMITVFVSEFIMNGCSDGPSVAVKDPAKGWIEGADIHAFYCGAEKTPAPMSIDVRVDSTLISQDYCWIKIFRDDGGTYGEVYDCKYELFDTSKIVSFADISLDTGTFWVQLALDNWSPSCNDPWELNNTYEHWGPFKIVVGTGICSTLTKTLDIEYDAQHTWTLLGLGSSGYLDSAFQTAKTLIKLNKDQTNLPYYVPPDTTSFENYLRTIHTTNYPMQLVGMEDFGFNGTTDTTRQIGWTLDGQFGPSTPNGVSIVFRGQAIDWFYYSPYNWNVQKIWEAVNRTTVHELGHQRANLSHQ